LYVFSFFFKKEKKKERKRSLGRNRDARLGTIIVQLKGSSLRGTKKPEARSMMCRFVD
jgi:hypothetical protein